jgi:hypothetical protein
MMKKINARAIVKDPVFRAGAGIQGLSGMLLGLVFVAIRFGWLDIVKIGLETPLDEPSPKLDALMWALRALVVAFASGFGFYALAIHRQERKGSPNQASHATSEPAPGAASSAREG